MTPRALDDFVDQGFRYKSIVSKFTPIIPAGDRIRARCVRGSESPTAPQRRATKYIVYCNR